MGTPAGPCSPATRPARTMPRCWRSIHAGSARTARLCAVGSAWPGPYDFLPLDGPVTRAAFGAVPDPSTTQPITYADAGDPSAFLATGDRDRTVRPANSDVLAARLAGAGVVVERRRYPALGHVGVLTALARPLRGRAAVLVDAAAFAHRVAGS